MSRTDMRMLTNPATKATKKQNSGRRPVWTTCAENQAATEDLPHGRPVGLSYRAAIQGYRAAMQLPGPGSSRHPARSEQLEDGGVGLAAALAHGLQAVLGAGLAHVVHQGSH